MTKNGKKVNVCFICDKMEATEEHHVEEVHGGHTIEICQNCHTVLTKYQEDAIPKLKKYLEEKSKQEDAIPKLKKYLEENP
jgi:cytochrome c2